MQAPIARLTQTHLRPASLLHQELGHVRECRSGVHGELQVRPLQGTEHARASEHPGQLLVLIYRSLVVRLEPTGVVDRAHARVRERLLRIDGQALARSDLQTTARDSRLQVLSRNRELLEGALPGRHVAHGDPHVRGRVDHIHVDHHQVVLVGLHQRALGVRPGAVHARHPALARAVLLQDLGLLDLHHRVRVILHQGPHVARRVHHREPSHHRVLHVAHRVLLVLAREEDVHALAHAPQRRLRRPPGVIALERVHLHEVAHLHHHHAVVPILCARRLTEREVLVHDGRHRHRVVQVKLTPAL